MTKQLVWLLYEKLPAFCKLAVSLCQVKKISPRKSISNNNNNNIAFFPKQVGVGQEHLQEFGIFYLANLMTCQLPKIYAKQKKRSSPRVWHNSLPKIKILFI